MGKIVNSKELDRLFKEIAVENPDNVNPRANDGSCLYRSHTATSQMYCIAASVLTQKLGYEYDPQWEGTEPINLFQRLGFDKETIEVVRKYQDDPEKPPVRWSTLSKVGN